MTAIHNRNRKTVGLVTGLCFAVTALRASPAEAYDYDTHSRIAELAVRAMRTAPAADTSLFFPPQGETGLYAQYQHDVRDAVAKLRQMGTGLPKKTQKNALDFLPTGGSSGEYPYSPNGASHCLLQVDEARDLTRLQDFSIAELNYYPNRDASPCGLVRPDKAGPSRGDGARPDHADEVADRTTELVLGWHAGGIDDHINDTVVWSRPTLTGLVGLTFEALSLIFEGVVGTVLLPFVCLGQAVGSLFGLGDGCHVRSSYDLARQYNPVDEIQGAIPGVGDIRDDKFTGLWHFEAVDSDVNRYNIHRGMWYPGAGPSHPGAFDVAVMAAMQIAGLSLNGFEADGTTNYGDFDKVHRTSAQWQAHTIATLEFSPLHNLAAYGWKLFLADPSSAEGLGWPLHAVGDACEPQHVTATSAWGHRPYEDYINEHLGDFLPNRIDADGNPDAMGQAAQDEQLARAYFDGYRLWKKLREKEDIGGFIHDLAAETRADLAAKGDWAFDDWRSTQYVLFDAGKQASIKGMGTDVIVPHADEARALLEKSISAAIAVLTVAGSHIRTPGKDVNCPEGQQFLLTSTMVEQRDLDGNVLVDVNGHALMEETQTEIGCAENPGSISTPLESLDDNGIQSMGADPTVKNICTRHCGPELPCPAGTGCIAGCCRLVIDQ